MAITDNYSPGIVPRSASPAMRHYLEDELNRIAELLTAPFLFLQPTYEAPRNPVTGMIAYADGTVWNPGAGEGAYIYQYDQWALIDSAKGFGGFDIDQTPQIFNVTPLYQIIDVYQRRLPVGRPVYGCIPNFISGQINVTRGGLWQYHINFSVQVPDAEILVFGIFVNDILALEMELENTNQIDFESGDLSGSGEVSTGDVIDVRIRSETGLATITFIHLGFDIAQMRTPL